MTNNFDDYPSRKIGGGNPYHCCSLCGRSATELFCHLERHESYCLYRKAKEAVIAGNKDDMFDLYVEMEGSDYCYELRLMLGKESGITNNEEPTNENS